MSDKPREFVFESFNLPKVVDMVDYKLDYEVRDENVKPKMLTHRYGEPFLLHGTPGVQICVAEYSDGSYFISTFGSPEISNFSYWNMSWKHKDFFKICEYCSKTGMHHHEGDYYWLCRNCKGTGWVQIKDCPPLQG